MNTSKRVAICVSGEVRTYQKSGRAYLVDFIERLERMGIEVDVFAHTWEHCDNIPYDDAIFKKLSVTDCNDIGDWIRSDITARILTHPDIEHTTPNDINSLIEISNYGYAQVFGMYYALQLAAPGYDLYIRWRWDLMYGVTYSPQPDQAMIDVIVDHTVNLLHSLIVGESYTDPKAFMYAMNASIIHSNLQEYEYTSNLPLRNLINDLFFVLDKSAYRKLMKRDIATVLHEIMSSIPPKRRPGYKNHGLWNIMMHGYDVRISVGELPNIFVFDRQ